MSIELKGNHPKGKPGDHVDVKLLVELWTAAAYLHIKDVHIKHH